MEKGKVSNPRKKENSKAEKGVSEEEKRALLQRASLHLIWKLSFYSLAFDGLLLLWDPRITFTAGTLEFLGTLPVVLLAASVLLPIAVLRLREHADKVKSNESYSRIAGGVVVLLFLLVLTEIALRLSAFGNAPIIALFVFAAVGLRKMLLAAGGNKMKAKFNVYSVKIFSITTARLSSFAAALAALGGSLGSLEFLIFFLGAAMLLAHHRPPGTN